MKRNLKALGLALVAAFALSAVVASSASAQLGKLTSDGSVTLKGKENTTGVNALTAFEGTVECPGATYTGHKAKTTPHERLASGATEITVTPHYGNNCVNDDADPITVDMNGCDYVFKDATTTGGVAGTYGVLVDIICPGSGIQVTGGPCTVRVPGQTNKTGLHATNSGNKIVVAGTVHSITAVACGFIHTTGAQQHQDVTIEGVDALGATTAISLSH